jgi:DNA-binding transcriptional MerR regulator
MEYSIHALAELAGLSVRTLHYYDEINLLKPSRIKVNGYRVYGEKELRKLQQIMFFRELEFPLSDIVAMVNSPQFNESEALIDQRKLLKLLRDRIDGILQTIDKTINVLKGGQTMSDTDLYGGLSQKLMDEYKKEAKERWGNTEAYKQSETRVKQLKKADWQRINNESNDFTAKLANLTDKAVSDPEVQKQVSRHYRWVSQFYDCPIEMYRNLGKMYVDDARFTAHYDKFKPGLAVFLRDAIACFCNQKSKSV